MEVSGQQDIGAIRDNHSRLAEEHRKYSLQLETLLAKPYPTEDDEVEEVRLKKIKLKLKDQMEALMRGTGSSMHAV